MVACRAGVARPFPSNTGVVMHRILWSIVFVAPFLLAACNSSPPADNAETTTAPAPAVTPAPAGDQVATASNDDVAPAPAETVAAAEPPPVGTCGDQSSVTADERIANTVRWSTASEQDNFGYDVYRGDSEKGDFTKLNAEPIAGAGTSDTPHKYEYRDDTIDPCKSYWYYVEAISTSGDHEKFTPTFQSKAKRRAADDGVATPASTDDAAKEAPTEDSANE